MTSLGRSGQAAWPCLPDSCQLHWQAAQGVCPWRPHPPASALFRQQAVWNSQTARRKQMREQALPSSPRAGSRQLRQQALRSSRRAGLQSQGSVPKGLPWSVSHRRCRHPHPGRLLPVQHALWRSTAVAQPRLQPLMQRAATLRRRSRCWSYAQELGLPSPTGPC